MQMNFTAICGIMVVHIANTNAGCGPLCFICCVTAGYEIIQGSIRK